MFYLYCLFCSLVIDVFEWFDENVPLEKWLFLAKHRWPIYCIWCLPVPITTLIAVGIYREFALQNQKDEALMGFFILMTMVLLGLGVLSVAITFKMDTLPRYLGPKLWVKYSGLSPWAYPQDAHEAGWIKGIADEDVELAAIGFLLVCAAEEEWQRIVKEAEANAAEWLSSVKIVSFSDLNDDLKKAREERKLLEGLNKLYKAQLSQAKENVRIRKVEFYGLWEMYQAIGFLPRRERDDFLELIKNSEKFVSQKKLATDIALAKKERIEKNRASARRSDQ